MELESVTARRRLATVAAHFPPTTNDPVSSASLVSLNCSSSLNSVIRRCDNKISFARQASSEQGFFMRQASTDEVPKTPNNGGIGLKNSFIRRGDTNRLYFARQASSAQGFFMRQAGERAVPQDIASTKCSATKTSGYISPSEEPLLSRPEYAPPRFSKAAKEDFFFPSVSPNQQKENWKQPYHPDLPKLANSGTIWSPRLNVAEFEHNYIVGVELPGASINDIRVEVDNTNLTVTGRRTVICHKQDIQQGPFQVSWSLPSNVNKDNVAAEFMDGLLRIVIPKL